MPLALYYTPSRQPQKPCESLDSLGRPPPGGLRLRRGATVEAEYMHEQRCHAAQRYCRACEAPCGQRLLMQPHSISHKRRPVKARSLVSVSYAAGIAVAESAMSMLPMPEQC